MITVDDTNHTDHVSFFDKHLMIIYAITLMAVLGVSSITPAFPKIAETLNIPVQSVGLLITVFTLPGIVLTPVLGVMADRYGRKRILIPSLFLFALAGGACGFVRDFDTLLIFRFFQGMGAASLGALNLTIVGDIFSGKRRTIAMGYNSSVLSVGTAAYPAIGGALAVLGWYFPFYLPFLAIPIALLVILSLDNPEPRSQQKFWSYLRGALKSMNNRRVIMFFIANLVTFIILYGVFLTYIPILLHDRFMASPALIGVTMSAVSVITAIVASQLRRLLSRFTEIQLLRTSFLLYASGLLIFPFIAHYKLIFIPVLLFGLGHGMNIPVAQSLVAGEASMEHRAAFMSINGMVLRLGQTLGPLIMGGIFLLGGISGIFVFSSVMTVAFSLLLLLML